MHDPFPIPAPSLLIDAVRPLATRLSLTTLPPHTHELLSAALLYTLIFRVLSPALSRRLFARTYTGRLGPRGRVNWDIHVTSLVQCLLVSGLALWVLSAERAAAAAAAAGEDWQRRLWEYDAAGAMTAAFAAGYFLWDVVVSAAHLDVAGPSSLVHAVAALIVTCIGFKPFAIHYGLRFVLYELSTSFLNIHWFLDKTGRTGSTLQLVNGIALLVSFFGARLVWGSYLSVRIYSDVWRAWAARGEARGTACAAYRALEREAARTGALEDFLKAPLRCREMPAWLALFYVGGNTALCLLNVYWFGRMIKAVRKRFVQTDRQRGGKRQEGSKKINRTAITGNANGTLKDHFE